MRKDEVMQYAVVGLAVVGGISVVRWFFVSPSVKLGERIVNVAAGKGPIRNDEVPWGQTPKDTDTKPGT